MNLYALMAGVILWGASLAATGWWSYGAGKDAVVAQNARDHEIAERAADAAAKAAATAIAGIEVKNTTIRQTLEREVRENTVYHDCRSGDAAVRLLNSSPGIAASGPEPSGDRKLPAADAAR